MITITQGLMQGQVLQRLRNGTARARVAGVSTENGPVAVRLSQGGRALPQWSGKIAGKAARGRWSADLKGLPAGGPYRVAFRIGAETLSVDDVFVGDVWILAGQSNMEGCGDLARPTPPDDRVRALSMDGRWGRAEDPLHEPESSPDPVHAPVRWKPKVLARLRAQRTKGVGPGISFGSEMARRSGGVPQGLIACAHGGTTMEQWDPRGKSQGGASLYGSMLRVCKRAGQPVAGILWHQGESDANRDGAELYFQRMAAFIRAVRKDLKQPRLPFLLAQLGREYNVEDAGEAWNRVQSEQARLAREIGRVACVATVDLPMGDSIHLSSEAQARLGRRFAAAADRLVYGNRGELPPPEIASVRRLRSPELYNRGNYGLEVTVQNAAGGLCASRGAVEGAFGLVDPDGKVTHPFFKAEIRGNRIRLDALRNIWEPENCRLVYGRGRKPPGGLADGRDLAVPVTGPLPILDPMALTKPFPRWKISEPLPAGVASLKSAPRPGGLRLAECERPTFISPVPNPPAAIEGAVCFFAEIDVPEAMRGQFRFGYDGPFKLWLDDRLFHADPDGVNPIVIDEIVKPVRLSKGRHRLTVAMDFSGGAAWGFLIRFARTGLTLARMKSGDYRLPRCG